MVSRDNTWHLMEAASKNNSRITGIKLSRNRGHQNAVLAGMMAVPCDAVLTIDADL
ncbi:MAG: glycosyltransferase [Holosporales bacterium]